MHRSEGKQGTGAKQSRVTGRERRRLKHKGWVITRGKKRMSAPAASLSNKTKGDKNIQEGRQRGACGKLIHTK